MLCYTFLAGTFVSYDFILFNIERDCIELVCLLLCVCSFLISKNLSCLKTYYDLIFKNRKCFLDEAEIYSILKYSFYLHHIPCIYLHANDKLVITSSLVLYGYIFSSFHSQKLFPNWS